MDNASLEILLDHGLWERCGGLKTEWKLRLSRESELRAADMGAEMETEKNKMRGAAAGDKSKLDSGMPFWLAKHAAKLYPYA